MNVEMFESDSALRDKRIRHDFLESTHYPFATFEATEVQGIPARDRCRGQRSTDDHRRSHDQGDHRAGDLHRLGVGRRRDAAGRHDRHDPDVDLRHRPDPRRRARPYRRRGSVRSHARGRSSGRRGQPARRERAADRSRGSRGRRGPVRRLGPAHPRVRLCVLSHRGRARLVDRRVRHRREGGRDRRGHRARHRGPVHAALARVGPEPGLRARLLTHRRRRSRPSAPGPTRWRPRRRARRRSWLPTIRPFDDIERDQVVPARGVYVGDLAVQDDYRCLVHEIDDPEGDGEWITGIAFEPDKDEVVHHSIIYRVPAAGREEADRLDGADGRPGWTCFGLSNLETDGVRSIGGWAPGQQPRVYPEGVGLYLEPGDFIVNQVHYHFDEETPPDQSVLVFDTMSGDELAERDEPMTHIRAAATSHRPRGRVRPRSPARCATATPCSTTSRRSTAASPGSSPTPSSEVRRHRRRLRRPRRHAVLQLLRSAGGGLRHAVFGPGPHARVRRGVPHDPQSGHSRRAGPARHPVVELRVAALLRADREDPHRAGRHHAIRVHLGPGEPDHCPNPGTSPGTRAPSTRCASRASPSFPTPTSRARPTDSGADDRRRTRRRCAPRLPADRCRRTVR